MKFEREIHTAVHILSSIAITVLIICIYMIQDPVKPDLVDSEAVTECKALELTVDSLKADLEYCKRCREANNKSLDLRKRDFNTIGIKLLECREAYQFILSHCEDY